MSQIENLMRASLLAVSLLAMLSLALPGRADHPAHCSAAEGVTGAARLPCLSHEINGLEQTMSQIYQELSQALSQSAPSDLRRIQSAQKAWVTVRNRDCTRATRDAPGAPEAEMDCLILHNRSRIIELRHWLEVLSANAAT